MKREDNIKSLTRRQIVKLIGVSIGSVYGAGLLAACSDKKEPLLRIASNVWPGYELLYMARDKQYFANYPIKLIEATSATACIQSLAAGTVEGAMLTLDEVLTARSEGLALTVIAVLDISMGADVLLAKPEIDSLASLKGKRIGVEESAVGAIMLDAILQKANLSTKDVEATYMTVSNHRNAYVDNKVDALITFEPVKTQLLTLGANNLFDSSEIPGRIIDVIAVLPQAINKNPKTLKHLVASHFKARNEFQKNPQTSSKILAKRLQIDPTDVPNSYLGIELPDVKSNHDFLTSDNPSLMVSANNLNKIMLEGKLLANEVKLSNLVNGQFLPKI